MADEEISAQDKTRLSQSEGGNLKPIKKGTVLNPNGRPKGSKNRTTIFREMLEKAAIKKISETQRQALGDDHDPETVADQIAAALVLKAMSGDVTATKEIMDSAFGKITDKIDNTHSFKKMGRVTKTEENEQGATKQTTTLTFQVGDEANNPEEKT